MTRRDMRMRTGLALILALLPMFANAAAIGPQAPIPVTCISGCTAGAAGAVQATAAAVAPTYVAGAQNQSMTLRGALRTILSIGGVDISFGQQLSAASLPVVLPSDGTLPLPTGAATSANQSSQITQETATAGAAGTTADAAYAGSGNASIVAALKGVYALIGKPVSIAYTYRSGTITAGGTAQNAAAANASRKTYFIQNPCSATEELWFRDDGSAATADQNSHDLNPCGSYELPAGLTNITAVSVIAPTTGHAFMFKEGQ